MAARKPAKPKTVKRASKTARKTRAPAKSAREREFEKRAEHFAEEVESLGNRFERHIDRKGDEWDTWFHRTFGIVGPFISSLFGILLLGLVTWVMDIFSVFFASTFLFSVNTFLISNMGSFFLIFLFFSYSSYFSKVSPSGYRLFSPISVGAGVAIAFWLAANALVIANISMGVATLSNIAFYMNASLWWIFGFTVMFGYVFIAVSSATGHFKPLPARRERVVSGRLKGKDGIHRLYRSGDERILGGVCGGIAEYLGVDPVLIRLFWVLSVFAWGSGIIAYIIAWIIIPRNPKDRWN